MTFWYKKEIDPAREIGRVRACIREPTSHYRCNHWEASSRERSHEPGSAPAVRNDGNLLPGSEIAQHCIQRFAESFKHDGAIEFALENKEQS